MTEKNVQVDLELKKAFAELQEKMIETKRNLKIADLQIESLKRERTVADLTEKEIAALHPSTRTYGDIGRMFIYQDINTVLQNLRDKSEKAEEKIKALDASKVLLERNLKDSENNLREMVQQWKNKAET